MTALPPQPPSDVPQPAMGVPMQPSQGQPAPTIVYMPPPVPHAPAPTANSKTPMIVGIVAVVVAVGGLVGFLVSRNNGGDQVLAVADVSSGAAPAPVFDIGSPPVAPAAPGAGDVPTPVTLPAPDVSAPVSVAPPPTQAPAPAPAPAPSSGSSSSGSGDVVDLKSGVRAPVPPGFTVDSDSRNDSFVWTYQGGVGEITTAVYDQLSSAEAAAAYYISNTLGTYLGDLQYTAPDQLAPDSPRLVDVKGVSYRGVIVSQQGGSIVLEGRFYVNVRVDGVIIIQDITWVGANDLAPPESIKPAASFYLKNFVYG